VLDADFFWMGYDDEFLYDSPEVRRHFVDLIREFRPDVVLGPDKDHDYHPDHIRTGQILWDTHIMTTVPNIRTTHPPCEHHSELWFFDTIAGLHFVPETYVDITEQWDAKRRMIECHASQNDWLQDQYGLTAVYYAETQSRFRGFQTGCTFAEAFRRPQVMPQSVPTDSLLPHHGRA
jgi:LmbE family N-acetylglucosaminyl deacetylase